MVTIADLSGFKRVSVNWILRLSKFLSLRLNSMVSGVSKSCLLFTIEVVYFNFFSGDVVLFEVLFAFGFSSEYANNFTDFVLSSTLIALSEKANNSSLLLYT